MKNVGSRCEPALKFHIVSVVNILCAFRHVNYYFTSTDDVEPRRKERKKGEREIEVKKRELCSQFFHVYLFFSFPACHAMHLAVSLAASTCP